MIVREIAGEVLLVPVLQTGVNLQKVYLLNETAAAIWDRLGEPLSLDQLVAGLQDEYDAAAEDLRADALGILNELADRELVDVVEEPS